MSAGFAVLVAVGAMVGAPLRFAVERRLASSWPWGTVLVNVVGSFVLGALVGAVPPESGTSWALALVGIGFCGALTTFGGFAAQVLDLATAPAGAAAGRRSARALAHVLVSVLPCLLVAWAGFVLSSALAA